MTLKDWQHELSRFRTMCESFVEKLQPTDAGQMIRNRAPIMTRNVINMHGPALEVIVTGNEFEIRGVTVVDQRDLEEAYTK